MSAKQIFWLQRLSAVAMIPPIKALFLWLFLTPTLSYEAYTQMVASSVTQWMVLLFMTAMLPHAGLGIYAILTDYVTERLYPSIGKLLYHALFVGSMLLLIVYWFCALAFVWS